MVYVFLYQEWLGMVRLRIASGSLARLGAVLLLSHFRLGNNRILLIQKQSPTPYYYIGLIFDPYISIWSQFIDSHTNFYMKRCLTTRALCRSKILIVPHINYCGNQLIQTVKYV